MARSRLIRKGLQAYGYSKNKISRQTISRMVHRSAEKKKEEVKKTVAEEIKQGKRFTCTVDEWSCGPKKVRELGVSLDTKGRKISLGLVKMVGSCPAEAMERLIIKKLDEFGVKLFRDIVAIACDGCALMQKLGKNLKTINQQLCLGHAIHLAVTKVLYKKKAKQTEPGPDPDSGSEEDVGAGGEESDNLDVDDRFDH